MCAHISPLSLYQSFKSPRKYDEYIYIYIHIVFACRPHLIFKVRNHLRGYGLGPCSRRGPRPHQRHESISRSFRCSSLIINENIVISVCIGQHPLPVFITHARDALNLWIVQLPLCYRIINDRDATHGCIVQDPPVCCSTPSKTRSKYITYRSLSLPSLDHQRARRDESMYRAGRSRLLRATSNIL